MIEKLGNKLKKGFLFLIFLLFISFLFDQLNNYIQELDLSKIEYKEAVINDIILVSKGEKDYILVAKQAVERGREIYMKEPNLKYKKNEDYINISSKNAVYRKDTGLLTLYEDVALKKDDLNVYTELINIDTQKNIAFNDRKTYIKSDKIDIEGINLWSDLKENIKLEKTITYIRGNK